MEVKKKRDLRFISSKVGVNHRELELGDNLSGDLDGVWIVHVALLEHLVQLFFARGLTQRLQNISQFSLIYCTITCSKGLVTSLAGNEVTSSVTSSVTSLS